jgi:hypothetical protein
MQKTAQKRSVLNKLREMTNVSGIAAEKFFNPQFQEVMENLRSIDATIRAITTGQEIEGADPDPSNTGDSRGLKDLLKSAKSNFNRREYMTSVAELGRFHKKFADIVRQIANLHNKVNEVHHQFLFQDLDEDHKKQLHDLKTRWASKQKDAMIKEASIMDFFYNIGTKRGRALAFYEKRYKREVDRLKKDTNSLLSKSEAILSTLLISLKEMAAARAARNVDSYMKASSKITSSYESYNNIFKEYYNTNVKGFLDKVPPVPTEKVDDKELGKTDIKTSPKDVPDLDLPNDNTLNTIIGPESGEFGTVNIPKSQPASAFPNNPAIPGPPPLPTNLGPKVPVVPFPEIPDTDPNMSPPSDMESNPPVGNTMYGVAPPANSPRQTMYGVTPPISPRNTLPQVSTHKKFYQTLEALSAEDPCIISAYIKKYAQLIQNTDPIVAIKLLQISKSIRG